MEADVPAKRCSASTIPGNFARPRQHAHAGAGLRRDYTLKSPKKQHGESLGFSGRRVHTRARRRVRRRRRSAARSEQPRRSQPLNCSVSGSVLQWASCGTHGSEFSREADLLRTAGHCQLHGGCSAALHTLEAIHVLLEHEGVQYSKQNFFAWRFFREWSKETSWRLTSMSSI